MRKLAKFAALASAVVMSMSMTLTAFAVESPQDPTYPSMPENVGLAQDKDGNYLTYSIDETAQEVKDFLANEENVKDVLSQAGYQVDANHEVVVLATGDLNIGKMPEGGIDTSFEIADSYGLQAGDTVYILHQKHDGTWEVFEAVVKDDGNGAYVDAHFDSFSPVAIVKVLSNGEVVILDKQENTAGKVDLNKGKVTEASSTVKVSPKTGR